MNKPGICICGNASPRILYSILLALLLPAGLLTASGGVAYQTHKIYFKNTDHELNVYRIFGSAPGKTLLVLGGIQGNEPGGYLSADRLIDTRLEKGNLIIVPRVNFYSILLSDRGANGDMNRKFDSTDHSDKDLLIIDKLKDLIRESDCLLNLHDGSGYYSPRHESPLRNPDMYGQSIIADCNRFYSKRYQQTFDLAQTAKTVCASVNNRIENPKHHFLFHNHNTGADTTRHPEQRKSATYFALTQCEIPAFGIETSKNINDLDMKVHYQTMVIHEFMNAFEIVKTRSHSNFPPPILSYLLISINGGPPVAVYNNKKLNIVIGDRINITKAEVNYERGVSVDIRGMGSINDLGQEFTITRETKIIVKKDSITCGSVLVRPHRKTIAGKTATSSDIAYLIVAAQNRKYALIPGERMRVTIGDSIKILDLITYHMDPDKYTVNFKGFVGNRKINTGEDRGFLINTSEKLMRKYSVNGQGTEYPIEVTLNDRLISRFYISLIP